MIRLDENYEIEVDECNNILKSIKVTQSGKGKGKERAKSLGYYHTMKEALERYGQEKVRDRLKDAPITLEQAVAIISDAWNEVSMTIREVVPEYEVTPVKN